MRCSMQVGQVFDLADGSETRPTSGDGDGMSDRNGAATSRSPSERDREVASPWEIEFMSLGKGASLP